MRWKRFLGDGKYILLNEVVNKIPCWAIRKAVYKALGVKIGVDSRIGIRTVIVCPQNISIGDRTIINEYCHIDGRGGLVIGNDTSISVYSKIISASHILNSSNFEYVRNKVVIGNNVWLGANAIVLDGSIIEDNAVIGAGTVFKGQALENGVYVGNPAQHLKERKLEKKYEIYYKPFFR